MNPVTEDGWPVDLQVVIDDLTKRIASLTKENAMLMAVLQSLPTPATQGETDVSID